MSKPTLQDVRTRLADILWPNGVLIDTRKGFELKVHEKDPSLPLSPIYISMRAEPKGKLNREQLHGIGACLFDLARLDAIPFDGITGIPEAGELLADGFAIAYERCNKTEVPRIRLQKKEEGNRRWFESIRSIEGNLVSGERILMIDDVASQANTKMEAVNIVRAGGFACHNVVIGIDREQGASAQLNGFGCCLRSVWMLRPLLMYYQKEGRVSPEDFATVSEYLAAS